MAFKLEIKPIVLIDTDEAVNYYEHKQTGLGKRFYDQLLSSFRKLQSNPFRYSYVKEPVRRILVNKFPYKMFYIVEQKTIIVIGISHTKRSNSFVKRRLRLLE